jgi:uncharacterized protein YjbI with pentapeptide repeats
LASEADAAARRITDLYTKAADQLGSEKAPVRLAGLYALERLAQDNPGQRRTIVNVLCAYLRMPYTLPGEPPADDNTVITVHRERVQEREVRLTAQRILAHHLRPGRDPENSVETFWGDLDLDLTGATLIDFDFDYCAIRDARFTQATFAGDARFNEAVFAGDARFTKAVFAGDARFTKAVFADYARFNDATFAGDADFSDASFTSLAVFNRASFSSGTWFGSTSFAGSVRFEKATFIGNVWFPAATFASHVDFEAATFTGNAAFAGATFTSDVNFNKTVLPSTLYVGAETPSPWTSFDSVRFARGVPPQVAQFVSWPEEAGDGDTQ